MNPNLDAVTQPQPDALARWFASCVGLGELDASESRALQAELTWVVLAPEAVLFRQGESGDSLFVVAHSRLAISVQRDDGGESVVDEAVAGQVVGEIAMLTGQTRSATVRALEAARLAKLSAKGVDRLTKQHPRLAMRLVESMVPRRRQHQLLGILTRLFGVLDRDLLAHFREKLTWRDLTAGECLMCQGEASDAVYIVVQGRLRVTSRSTAEPAAQERFVREVGAGEIIGEVGLLTGAPRSATVTAIRGATVVRLSAAACEALIAQHPRVMVQVARLMAGRQVGVTEGKPKAQVALTFALVSGDAVSPVTQVAARLAATLAAWGETLHLSSARFDAMFGRAGAAQTTPDDPLHLRIVGWLSEQETRYRYILYEADRQWSAWTQRCTQQADRIFIVKQAKGDPTPDPLERALADARSQAPLALVLVHADDCKRPSGTAAWLQPRNVGAHHHLRLANPDDWKRLARWATGWAVGVVLSGGGARGNAHLGVLSALGERGIPVDVIGGASAGAIVSGLYALDLDLAAMTHAVRRESSRKRIFDYTPPLTSLLASTKVTALLQRLFGDTCIEDLWIPYFCVSCNLSRAAIRVHATGPLWAAVRASIAIPGIFAPVLDQGDVLVDGGVINSFPVDVMQDHYRPGVVLGVNLDPPRESFQGYRFGPSLSGWQLLWQRLNPFATPIRAPSLMSILSRSHDIHSIQNVRAKRALVDLLIEPNVAHIRIDQYGAFDEAREIGYRAACAALADWEEKRRGHEGAHDTGPPWEPTRPRVDASPSYARSVPGCAAR